MVNILGGIKNMLGSVGGSRAVPSGTGLSPQARKDLVPFVKTLRMDDFFTSDVSCTTAKWNELGAVTVSAQQQATFGASQLVAGGVQGLQCYIRLDSLAGEIAGLYRLRLENAQNTYGFVVMEERSERLSADKTDRSKSVLLPEYSWKADEDSRLVVYLKPDNTTTVDYSDNDSEILIPATFYQ